MRARVIGLAVIATLAPALPAGAQLAQPVGITPVRPPSMDTIALVEIPLAVARRPGAPPWWTPLASAAIPGAGQAKLGQDRFVAYLAVEAYALLQYFTDRREAQRQRSEYRELARRVARAFFSEERPVGSFDYYEQMTKFVESGVYDLEPGGDLQPELDTASYNGSQWRLARQTFWSNPDSPPDPSSPEYISALNFYRARAIGPEYRWSWRNAQLEQDIFRRTIGLSNDANRRAIADLGVVLANHALSMVDAYISIRLQQPRSGSSVGLSATIPWAPFGAPPNHPETGK
jgi:hypothetical protein